jgi:hypothetical protein
MRPLSALGASTAATLIAIATLTATATLTAAAPASAATWTAPTSVAAPHTFVSPLRSAASGNGTALLDWRFQDGIGSGATAGARGATMLPGASAFGPERTLPGATSQVVPYATRSVAALIDTAVSPARRRLSVAFGSVQGPFGGAPNGPFLGTPRTVATDDVAFVPSLAVGANGSGLLAWVARATGSRRVVKVSLRGPGGRFGAPSIVSGTGRANAVVAAVGERGERVVAFERGGRLLARVRAVGHNWGPIQDLGAVAAGTDNELAALVAGAGRTTIVDVHRQLSEGGDTGSLLVDAWVRPAGASRFRAAQRLESGGQVQSSPPALVPLDSRGAMLAWLGTDPASQGTPGGPGRRVNVSIMGPDARFGAPQALSAPGEAAAGLGAASNGDEAIASWVRLAPTSDSSGQVLAAVRLSGAGFAPAEVVSPAENALLTAPGFVPTTPGHPFVAWAARPGGEGPGVPIAQIQTLVRFSRRQP